MTLFKNSTAQGVWIDHWCGRCWRQAHSPHATVFNCPILAHALTLGRKPKQWTRNPRAQTMAEQMKCDEYATTPPRPPKVQLFEDVSMFDDDAGITVTAYTWVPVDGWPDNPRSKGEGDHA